VLEEASEGFQIIREDENTGAEETLTIDKLTATGDTSPIIRLSRYHDFYGAAAARFRYSH